MEGKFAEWLAQNHWTLYNVTKNEYYWRSPSESKLGNLTTKQLLNLFKQEDN